MNDDDDINVYFFLIESVSLPAPTATTTHPVVVFLVEVHLV